MTTNTHPVNLFAPIPPGLAELMWPQVPGVLDDIVAAIRRDLPELAPSTHGVRGQILRRDIETLLNSFIQHVADPYASFEERDSVCRRLGRFEAHQGRTLDSLQAAYRLGLRLVWRRSVEVGHAHDLDPDIVARMGDAAIAYVNELADQTSFGYRQAHAEADADRAHMRISLIRHILADDLPDRALSELATSVGWRLPSLITPVGLHRTVVPPGPLGPAVLADWEAADPFLLLPGAVDDDSARWLGTRLGVTQLVIGVPVPVPGVANSLRWARALLRATDTGARGAPRPSTDDSPLRCADHLITLLLHSDLELTAEIFRQHLSPLDGLPSRQRRRLLQTLKAHLTTRGSATEVAALLGVHPQTVRYRLRQLDELLGTVLRDPETRFAIEIALRASTL